MVLICSRDLRLLYRLFGSLLCVAFWCFLVFFIRLQTKELLWLSLFWCFLTTLFPRGRPGLEECTECIECTNARAPYYLCGTVGFISIYGGIVLVLKHSVWIFAGMTHTVVPTTHTVVVCVMKGWRGKPLITMGLLMLVSSTHLVVTGEKTHTVVPYAHPVVVCVVRGGGEDPWWTWGP